jgi:hypothetical protein
MANEMTWANNNGVLTNNTLNKDFRMSAQPMARFRQFVSLKEAFGKMQGESVNWDKIANVSDYGGLLVETNTMHETTQVITKGTLTVNEYGNSIPYTGKIEALSELEVREYVNRGLRDDMVKCIDGVVEREFNKTPLRYVGTTTTTYVLTTNSIATATNTSALNSYHIRKMALALKTRFVPGYAGLGGDYAFIGSYEAVESLRGAMESTVQYVESGFKMIVNGEIGRIGGVRIVEDGFASRYVYSSSAKTATAISWTTGNSLVGYMCGDQTVREAVAVPEEIRMKVVTDYGRSKGFAWYFLGGWAIEWSDAANARVVKWDSAA